MTTTTAEHAPDHVRATTLWRDVLASEWIKQDIVVQMGVAPKKIQVIPDGIPGGANSAAMGTTSCTAFSANAQSNPLASKIRKGPVLPSG